MTERHIWLSVIVPVYKVEAYLPACIDSVACQIMPGIELILVDDGSPDNSGRICDQYREKYTFITVIHKKNGGLSDARNEGIRHAQGDYLLFLDGDDRIAGETFVRLKETMKGPESYDGFMRTFSGRQMYCFIPEKRDIWDIRFMYIHLCVPGR